MFTKTLEKRNEKHKSYVFIRASFKFFRADIEYFSAVSATALQ